MNAIRPSFKNARNGLDMPILAKELGPKKITVNVVSPRATDTELFNQGKSEEHKQRFAQMAALGRLGHAGHRRCCGAAGKR